MKPIPVLLTLSLTVAVAGCGSEFTYATVNGTVTYDGQPVTEGTLVFSPVMQGEAEPGKPAAGEIQGDGTFVLGSQSLDDGAIVGTHRVTYEPPSRDDDESPSPFAGWVVSEPEILVVEGDNQVTVELVRR